MEAIFIGPIYSIETEGKYKESYKVIVFHELMHILYCPLSQPFDNVQDLTFYWQAVFKGKNKKQVIIEDLAHIAVDCHKDSIFYAR